MEKHFYTHDSGLGISRDGEVFVPQSGKKPAHYTYGWDNGKGYSMVKYQGKHYQVHRLVAECYIPNPENKPEIDHIIPVSDGGTNDVSNLRWCTSKENQNNPLTRQKMQGEQHPLYGKHHSEETLQKMAESHKGKHHSEESRQKISETMKGKHNKPKKPVVGVHKKTGITVEFESATDAWITLNINKGDICSCCRGKKKSAGGYEWHYA